MELRMHIWHFLFFGYLRGAKFLMNVSF